MSLALAGALGAAASGFALANTVLLDAAVTLGLSTGVLTGVALAQAAREKPAAGNDTQAKCGSIAFTGYGEIRLPT